MKLTEKNKAFWALSKPEQRVQIAEDVILQIEIGKLNALSGTYLSFSDDSPKDKKLDKIFSSIEKCNVCGIGACFYGMVVRGNSVSSDILEGVTKKVIKGDIMKPLLTKIFTRDQLALIEASFETYSGFGLTSTNSNTLDRAISFGERYSQSNLRLKKIMQNIINNHGYFRP